MKRSTIRFGLLTISVYPILFLVVITFLGLVSKKETISDYLVTMSFLSGFIMYIGFIIDTFQLWKEGK